MNEQIVSAFNFCNRFLMIKILDGFNSKTANYHYNQEIVDKSAMFPKKNVKGSKLENPRRKINQQCTNLKKQQSDCQNKLRGKKKKFQTHFKNNIPRQQNSQQYSTKLVSQKNKQQQGYVPIQQLITNLQTKHSNKGIYDNNFVSFGSNSSKINSYQPFGFEKNMFQTQYAQDYPIKKSWVQRENRFDSKNFIPNKSQQFFESPIRQFRDKISPGYCVPASRSRSPLSASNSCTNLSSNRIVRQVVRDSQIVKKKKKGERSFYIPSNNSNSKQNLELSRCTSSNNIIAKFQRQILDQVNDGIKNEKYQTQKSKMQQTRLDTKTNKRQSSIIRQLEQYSAIQFENGVRESLSFLSEARGPPRPIVIEMKK